MFADTSSLFRGKNWREKDGIFYFASVPEGVVPESENSPVFRKEKWTYWRTQCFEFLKRELEDLPQKAVILDLGAGSESAFREPMKNRSAYAVDFYPYKGVHVVCDLNKDLPFQDECADCVILSNVLEHIAEPNVLLAECARMLRPGGILLVAVPFLMGLHQKPHDYYRYTSMNLEYLFAKHGYAKGVVHPVAHMPSLIKHLDTEYFEGMIRKAACSKSGMAQRIKTLFLRVLWRGERLIRGILDSKKLFPEGYANTDYPLGYLCKTRKKRAQ